MSHQTHTANLDLLRPIDHFANRHLGPQAADQPRLLAAIGAGSLAELMDQAVPESIRFRGRLDLPAPRSESEALADLRQLADQN
ncbi:MAG: hypothetical protein ACRDHL_12020, partial [Candidatus Promineifilaceae bacterium]